MTSYSVYMINFGMFKGTFATVEQAIAHARTLGFECSIVVNEPGRQDSMHLCTVKPY